MTIFALVLGAMSLMVGVPKLLGVQKIQDDMREVGVDLNLMRIIGGLEVAAGVGLQIESLRSLAAGGMILMMIGAIGAHARAKHPPQRYAPSIVFLILMIVFLAMSL